MYIFDKITSLQTHLQGLLGKSIGFVPTMGALHQGHLNLVRESKLSCDITIVSVFVNPIQFNNAQDFEKYPNTLENDALLLEELGCDILFAPTAHEMYAQKPALKFDFGSLETVMEGKFRPGHFNGVAIVVSKLFHIVQPTHVFFGQKDFQQCAVIKQMISDLSFNLKMKIVATTRETSGLAMSSRNVRLSESGKEIAANIFKALSLGKSIIENDRKIHAAKEAMLAYLANIIELETEYLEIADAKTLLPIENIENEIVICYAGFLEGVRLIDNVLISEN